MQFLSFKVRHYRVHQELVLDFDPARTLIGGANEAGKSTLVEALHRTLFLKAKGNTESHRAMVSTRYPGQPETELTFLAGGVTYVLKKRFGTNGTTTLTASQRVGMTGDAAEAELARILGIDAASTGKAMSAQWSHLWVWQGQAGDDPTVHASLQSEGLLQRLQTLGGGAAIQSELDTRVARHFSAGREQLFTQAGRPKVGSAVELAERYCQTARDEFGRATERVQRLQQAVDALTAATRRLESATSSASDLSQQRDEVTARLRQLDDLRRQESERLQWAREAEVRWQKTTAAEQQIAAAIAERARLEPLLAPQEAALSAAEKRQLEAQGDVAHSESLRQVAATSIRAARLRQELASGQLVLLRRAALVAPLRQQAQRVEERQRDAAGLRDQLSQLAPVDTGKLARLQESDASCTQARTTVQAMATGLEVRSTNLPILAGATPLTAGQVLVITESVALRIGNEVELRIQPGGGTGLSDARRRESTAQAHLQQQLDALGLSSLAQAVEVHARRDHLTRQLQVTEAELKGLAADRIASELTQVQHEVHLATANVDRLKSLVPDQALPDTTDGALTLVQHLAEAFQTAEYAEKTAISGAESALANLHRATADWQQRQQDLAGHRQQWTGLQAQLQLLEQTHGDESVRTLARLQAERDRLSADAQLQALQGGIRQLQPELLAQDAARIERALLQKNGEREEARIQIAVAQATLKSDGSEDPAATRAMAVERLRSAEEQHREARRKADAIALLDDLFREEQRALATQFTAPLVDRISGYLQCLFGPTAQAQVGLDDQEFTGLQLLRADATGGAFNFNSLSGGAREQLAAAFRLAMAEVLAVDFDGCLPVIFDDAFAYSDPARVRQLQRMLDLAASRGLQVIVLSCTPADYSGLGARTISLG